MNKLSVEQTRDDMHDKLKAIHRRTDEILEQVKRTNGRVGRLEDWKAQLTGGLKVSLLVTGLFAFNSYRPVWIAYSNMYCIWVLHLETAALDSERVS